MSVCIVEFQKEKEYQNLLSNFYVKDHVKMALMEDIGYGDITTENLAGENDFLKGEGVGAFLHGYVPQEFFIKYMGENNLLAIPMAVIAGIPLYADATTIIPIAQVLIQKGAAIGTVLVFMMAVVGLSLPEMIILSRVMKKELIIRYVIFMFITFTIIGYFYNFVLC
jgi:hypothetical protein